MGPTAVSIEQAIQHQLFQGEHSIKRGDVDRVMKQCDMVMEGEMRVGGQEHFYLETNACIVTPSENGEMSILASTQNPSKTQVCMCYISY